MFCIFSPLRQPCFFHGGFVSSNQDVFCFIKQHDHATQSVCVQGTDADPARVERCWCDPGEFQQIIGVDCGGGKAHYYNLLTDVYESRNVKTFLRVAPSFGSNGSKTLLVAEQAHFAIPQTTKSLAQPYTQEELLNLYAECQANGVTVKLFPHAHTRKARDWVAANIPESRVQKGKSSDENDARGIAYFVKHNNSVSLMNPPTSFERTDRARYVAGVICKSNEVLNIMRRHDYERQKLKAFWDFAFEFSNNCKLTADLDFIDRKIAFSLASLVITEECDELYRFTYKGRVPGVNFWRKKVLKFSPFHQGAGVARSNINWHGFRHYIVGAGEKKGFSLKIGTNKYKQFCDYTSKENEFKTQCWEQVRRQVNHCYSQLVQSSAGFKSYAILQDKEQP
jgi:hypothetical protein